MTIWLEIGGRRRKVELQAAEGGAGLDGRLQCVLDGAPLGADARVLQPGVLSLIVDGKQYRCVLDGSAVLVNGQRFEFTAADPRSLGVRRIAGDAAGGAHAVKAPMPGRVVRVLVEEGDAVEAQQGLVVIEAMKMQNELKSPRAGTITRLAVAVGATVQPGEVLVVVA